MGDQRKIVNKAASDLQEVARIITKENPVLGGELDLLASNMETIGLSPPTKSINDFDLEGEEVTFPEESNESTAIFERIIDQNDLLPASFLEFGAEIQRGVARIMLKKTHSGLPAGNGWGTGFLVSPSLLLTNNHVIPNHDIAKILRIQFNYQVGTDGLDRTSDIYETAATELFQTNKSLDYTLIKVRSKQFSNDPVMGTGIFPPGNRWGFIELNDSPNYRKGQHCNIVQHPNGRKKEIALQKNEISRLYENVVRYVADTEPGSSGSPVLDNVWQLIALHHAGGEQDATGKWLNNQGIRIDKIIENLRNELGTSHPEVINELGI